MIEPTRIDFEISVSLGIDGFECDPIEISRILDIEPTRTLKPGDKRTLGRRAKVHLWDLTPPVSTKNCSITDQVAALKEIIEPRAPNFSNLPKGCVSTFGCVVYAYQYVPPICFSAEELGFFSSIGADMYVNLYDLTASEV